MKFKSKAASTLGMLIALSGCTLLGTGPDNSDSGGPKNDGGSGSDGGGSSLLPVDCTNLANLHTTACSGPTQYDSSKTIGSGPHFVDTLDVVHPGFTDQSQNRIIVGLGTMSGGVILAVDVTTGTRSVISGPNVGTGAALPEVWNVQPGPDGWYALGNGSVWRIDPKTGNRTKVWDTTIGDAKCTFATSSGGLLYDGMAGGMAIAADGTIYLPVITSQGSEVGTAIIAVTASTCKLVSQTGYPTSLNHGTGPDVIGIKNQFALEGTKLFILDGTAIGSVDLATGNRAKVADSTTGSGPDVGDSTIAATSDGKSAWTACGYDKTYVSANLASGDRNGVDPYPNTPLSIGGPWCNIWVHPTQPLLVVEDAKGFALFDPATGNSNVISY